MTDREGSELIVAYMEGTLDAGALADLHARLREDAALRRRFVLVMLQAGGIHDALGSCPAPKPLGSDRAISESPVDERSIPIYRQGCEPRPSRIRPYHGAISGIAAALLVACGLAAYFAVFADAQSDGTDPSPQAPVATLIKTTGGTLTTPGGFIAEGRDYGRGEYTLDRGTAEFMLTNAVNVKFRGETRMVVHNDMHVSLSRGSVAFAVPRDATGFAVHLPGGAKVIDLGTRFRVIAGDSKPHLVEVLEGSVRLELANGEAQELTAGRIAELHDASVETRSAQPRFVSRWVRPIDTPTSQGRIDRPFEGSDFAEGLTIEAAFRVADASRWDDRHVWSIFRREAAPRVLLAIQNSANIGTHGDGVGDTERSGLSFGLVTGVYDELDVALDGREGRPMLDDLFDGEVHHVAATYDRVTGVKALYIDGRLIAETETANTGDLNIAPSPAAAEIGVHNGGERFGGELLSVVVYDEPLDESKIERSYRRWVDGDEPQSSAPTQKRPADGE